MIWQRPSTPKQPLNWNVVIDADPWPFGHSLAFAFDGRVWIVVDPHLRWTQVFTLADGPEFDSWVREVAARSDIFRIEGRGLAPIGPGWFCVGTVKRLVGLRSGALSPAGLKRDLLRAGARQVFIRENENSQGRPEDQVGA
jgi:hypothetical protein